MTLEIPSAAVGASETSLGDIPSPVVVPSSGGTSQPIFEVAPAENGPWFIIRRNGNVVRSNVLLPLIYETEEQARKAADLLDCGLTTD